MAASEIGKRRPVLLTTLDPVSPPRPPPSAAAAVAVAGTAVRAKASVVVVAAAKRAMRTSCEAESADNQKLLLHPDTLAPIMVRGHDVFALTMLAIAATLMLDMLMF